MLKQRVITALVLAAVFLGALFILNGPWFSLFAAAVLIAAAREWADLSGLGRTGAIGYTIAGAAVILALYQFLGVDRGVIAEQPLALILMCAASWWAVALLWVQGYPSSALLWGSRPVRAAMGFLVLVPPWLAISWLVTLEGGRWLVILVVFTVACADIGAYFAGKAFGRHKLAVQVSPGKTIEGFAGGVLLVIVVASVIIIAIPSQRQLWLEWTIIEVCTVLASVLGDLLESMVKRHRGVKDSGNILPGHGGFLDRVDSISAALPVFALLYLLLIHQAL